MQQFKKTTFYKEINPSALCSSRGGLHLHHPHLQHTAVISQGSHRQDNAVYWGLQSENLFYFKTSGMKIHSKYVQLQKHSHTNIQSVQYIILR